MSILGRPLPVKPLVSIIFAQPEVEVQLLGELQERFGPADLVSPWLPFTHTSYYAPEMGPVLQRRLMSFLHLAGPGKLPEWKLFTVNLEGRYSLGARRLVNIDPGYLLSERFVLATGKNFTHRIYIGQNIYADLTLVYQNGVFQTLPWTYPDYADRPVLTFLGQVRKKYILDKKSVCM